MVKNVFISIFFVLFNVFCLRAQIIAPATTTTGTPVTFTTPAAGRSFTWLYDTVDVNQVYTPTLRTRTLASSIGNSVLSMVHDDGNNRWYLFSTNSAAANNTVTRADLGSDPHNASPVLTNFTAGAAGGANFNRAVTAVKDEVSGNWHVFIAGALQLWRLDFGTSLANTPAAPVKVMDLPSTGSRNNLQMTVVKDGTEWYAFIGNHVSASGIMRIKLGTSLVSGTPVALAPLNAAMDQLNYFSLYRENGTWYMLSIHMGGTLVRFELGATLDGTPTFTNLGNPGNFITVGSPAWSNPRGCFLFSDCNQLALYAFNTNHNFGLIKYDFNGSILNTPSASMVSLPLSAGGNCVNTYIYQDTLFAQVNRSNAANSLWTVPVLPLPAGGSHKFNDPAAVHTFTAPGAYNITLYVNQAQPEGPSAFCHQITVSSGALPQPGAFTDSSSAVCRGQRQVTYTVPPVPGATSYQWTYSGTGHTINGTGNSVTIDFSASATGGILRVSAVSASGTGPSRDMSVTVNPLPAVTIMPSGPVSLCQGDSVLLSVPVTSGATYVWKRGQDPLAAIAAVYPAKTAGSYRVVVTTASGCRDSSAIVGVTVNSLPDAAITPAGSRRICQGDTLLIAAVAGSTPGVTYAWQRGSTGVGSNASYKATAAGSYRLAVTDNSTGCSDTSAAAVLTVSPLPAAVITPSGTVLVCSGDSVLLEAAAGTGSVYEWRSATSVLGQGQTYKTGVSGAYKVVVTDSNNCMDSSTAVSVVVYPRPAYTIAPGDTAFCAGEKVILSVPADTSLDYQWKDAQGNIAFAVYSFLEVSAPGNYTVLMSRRSVAGCADSAPPVTVTVHPLPVPGISWDGLQLTADSMYSAYQWYAEGQPIAGASASSWQPLVNGSYGLVVIDSNGCSNTAPVIYNVHNVSIPGLAASEDDIRVYPNPASSVIYIDAPAEAQLSVFSMEGREVLHAAGAGMLDLTGLPDGVYLIRIANKHGRVLKRENIMKAGKY